MNNDFTFWAICYGDGSIEVDEYGRSLVFLSRSSARNFLANYVTPFKLRIDKVEIR